MYLEAYLNSEYIWLKNNTANIIIKFYIKKVWKFEFGNLWISGAPLTGYALPNKFSSHNHCKTQSELTEMFKNNFLTFVQDGYKANDSEIWIKDDSNRTKPIDSAKPETCRESHLHFWASFVVLVSFDSFWNMKHIGLSFPKRHHSWWCEKWDKKKWFVQNSPPNKRPPIQWKTCIE